jgi:hypothetical protein
MPPEAIEAGEVVGEGGEGHETGDDSDEQDVAHQGSRDGERADMKLNARGHRLVGGALVPTGVAEGIARQVGLGGIGVDEEAVVLVGLLVDLAHAVDGAAGERGLGVTAGGVERQVDVGRVDHRVIGAVRRGAL